MQKLISRRCVQLCQWIISNHVGEAIAETVKDFVALRCKNIFKIWQIACIHGTVLQVSVTSDVIRTAEIFCYKVKHNT